MTKRCHKSRKSVDRLIRRQEVLTAQSDAKTVADCAMEVSYVMQLSQALLEAGDIIEESTTARHRYLDVQREHEETLEQQGGSKRRATGTTRTSAPAPAVLTPIATLSHEGSPELPRRVVDNIIGNLQHLPDSWPLIRFDLMLHKSAFFFLRLPNGQYGPVSQLSWSEKSREAVQVHLIGAEPIVQVRT